MARYVLAIDQGTTSTRVILFDAAGRPAAPAHGSGGGGEAAQREHSQFFPAPARVEHDAMEILAATTACIKAALANAGATARDVAAVGITNQRETVVVWDRATGVPLYNALVWQDQRGKDTCDALAAASPAGSERFKAATGLPLVPYFSATKLKWLLDHVDGVREGAERGDVLAGTIDTFLIWHLTGGAVHATDVTNASRTLLFNIHTMRWDDDLCATFGVPRAMLPRVLPSSAVFGTCSPASPLPGVVIGGVLGDQQAALFGQACLAPGDAKCTYGTGCFMLMNTGATPVASAHGLLTTVAYQLGDAPPVYALEGSVAVAGSVVNWLRDNLKLIRGVAEVEPLARSVEDAGGVTFVPAFNGLFAPHWRADARGLLIGLTGHTTTAHVVRAALEAVALQCKEVLDAMAADAGSVADRAAFAAADLRVDGGMTGNSLLMQLQADFVARRVVRPEVAETTALGAAYAAGLAVGFWRDVSQLQAQWRVAATWSPVMPRAVVAATVRRWHAAVSRTLGWTNGTTLAEVGASAATGATVPAAAVGAAAPPVDATPPAVPTAAPAAVDAAPPAVLTAPAAPPAAADDDDALPQRGGIASAWGAVFGSAPQLSATEAAARRQSLFATAVTLATGAIMGLALANLVGHASGASGSSGGGSSGSSSGRSVPTTVLRT